MAEAIVSGILKGIIPLILAESLKEVKLLTGVEEDVSKFSKTLTAIQASLEYAEERQLTHEGLKAWLDQLKDVSLDMEDALDLCRTNLLLSLNTHGASSFSQVRRFLGRSYVGKFSIPHKIRDINARLDKIALEKNRYRLPPESNNSTSKQSKRPESASVNHAPSVLGRDEVKNRIIKHLVCATHIQLQSIFIVGMGGLGKTTLAQLVYSDPEVVNCFGKHRIWVCISEVFDVIKVARTIILELHQSQGAEGIPNLESLSLDGLLKRLCKFIKGQKFFLVLDDVWTENGDDFKQLILCLERGAPGSWILVTTRKTPVATLVKTQLPIHLETLSDEVCQSILMEKAQGEKTCQGFKEVGKKIAEKCKGLPLVAHVLGGLLQGKSKKEWDSVLNSELWSLDIDTDRIVQKEVIVPLLLSYYDLPLPARKCFTYCAIFAKGTAMYTCHLIAHWRAQGYLGVEEDSCSLELELIGQRWYEILVARSLFQNSCSDGGDRPPLFKIHDLIHDFALFMCKDEFQIEEVSGGTEGKRKRCRPKEKRHLTLKVSKDVQYPSMLRVEKLRSVMGYGQHAIITRKDFANLFKEARRLRLLDVEMHRYQDSTIPDEVGKLLHLRYLNFSRSHRLVRLPKEVCKLFNLQFLDLFDSCIEKLPDDIGTLINLKFLRTSACHRLRCYPKGVSKLTRLTQLVGLIVRVDRDHPKEFSLGDLANLKRLMILCMKVVGDTIDGVEATKVNLEALKELKICADRQMQRDETFESLNMSNVPLRSFDSFSFNKGFNEPRSSECLYCGF